MRYYRQVCNVFDRAWAKDAKAVSLYLYLHCNAYVQDWKLPDGRLVRRGSCPTSRASIIEGTGLSEYDVKSRLNKLQDFGEIIINSSNMGMIITVCDYDYYNIAEDLFSLNSSSELPSGLPNGLPNESPTLYNSNTENNIYNNLRSRYTPSKKRESNKELALEIKAIYNKMFDGLLRKWERLSADMIIKVENCVNRFGRQSVDMVFDQVKHEKFSLGDNNTGFIADFAFIFKLNNYEAYMGRYELRLKQGNKKQEPQQAKQKGVGVIQESAPAKQSRRDLIISWVDAEAKEPSKRGQELLQACYESGELKRLGIDWKPNLK